MQVLSFIHKENPLVSEINKLTDPFLANIINKLTE